MIESDQSTRLKQDQALALTPRLIQSIGLLQLNHQELTQEITQMLENNIMLRQKDAMVQVVLDNNEKKEPVEDTILDELDADTSWEDYYDDELCYRSSPKSASDPDTYHSDNLFVSRTSFDDKIIRAIRYGQMPDDEQALALQILASLDEHYFLTQSDESLSKQLGINKRQLRYLIEIIKHLDPPGIASRDIRECMLAQLHCLPDYSDDLGNAHDILTDYFHYIGHKETMIARRLRLSNSEMIEAMRIIRSLNPYPNSDADDNSPNTIWPDVYIHQRMGIYYASLNPDFRTNIEINETYVKLADCCSGDEKLFIRAQLQTAKFFLNALAQRQSTILRVSNAVIVHQQGFFTHGDKALKPLTLKNIADILGIHESTVSRAISGKYCYFDHKLIALGHFFSQKVSAGAQHSAKSVQAYIKSFVESEDARNPLSDVQLADKLAGEGIAISERVIAKYREHLGIAKRSRRRQKN
ncbi:MAG: RNA polymerase sigma-54 factor [Gammaproteobacteria bacterium]|nr:MAG: RNA polymerase sigma-54 factor [Gammaproteobacteria bacterium]